MVILFVATVGLIAAAALALWPGRPGPAGSEAGSEAAVPGRGRGPEPEPEPEPSSLEGILVAQLIKGEISHRQYLRAMERIAARDEERHPLTIPRDDHPGACA